MGIETGTDVCSVSLSRGGELLALRESGGGQDHARKLAVYIDKILRDNDLRPEQLDAVAVSKGPGSYTGLRIGVSTAKGLCYGLGIPLCAVSSTEALAWVAVQDHAAARAGALLCPMIDARRMEVYAQVFGGDVRPLSEVEAVVVTPESFAEFIRPVESADFVGDEREFLIFGNGAAKCAELLAGTKLIEVATSARGLVRPAFEAFTAGRFEDIAYFEPLYLKDFVVTTTRKSVV